MQWQLSILTNWNNALKTFDCCQTGAHEPPPQPVSPSLVHVGSSLEDDYVDQGVDNQAPNGHPPANHNPLEDTQWEHGDLLTDFKVEYVDVFSVEGDICNATNCCQYLKCYVIIWWIQVKNVLHYYMYVLSECLSVQVFTVIDCHITLPSILSLFLFSNRPPISWHKVS